MIYASLLGLILAAPVVVAVLAGYYFLAGFLFLIIAVILILSDQERSEDT